MIYVILVWQIRKRIRNNFHLTKKVTGHISSLVSEVRSHIKQIEHDAKIFIVHITKLSTYLKTKINKLDFRNKGLKRISLLNLSLEFFAFINNEKCLPRRAVNFWNVYFLCTTLQFIISFLKEIYIQKVNLYMPSNIILNRTNVKVYDL